MIEEILTSTGGIGIFIAGIGTKMIEEIFTSTGGIGIFIAGVGTCFKLSVSAIEAIVKLKTNGNGNDHCKEHGNIMEMLGRIDERTQHLETEHDEKERTKTFSRIINNVLDERETNVKEAVQKKRIEAAKRNLLYITVSMDKENYGNVLNISESFPRMQVDSEAVVIISDCPPDSDKDINNIDLDKLTWGVKRKLSNGGNIKTSWAYIKEFIN